MKRIYLLIILLCLIARAPAQTIIEGIIKSENGSPLPNVSVTVSKRNASGIIAFGISGSTGVYKLIVDSKDDSIILKASFLGYQVAERSIINKSGKQDFTLLSSPVMLKDILVKNNIIRQSKDTLNYNVQSFSTKEDKTIGDVIKRMPGIEVTDNGKIYYQGTAIQAFLVNGLDLLEGKYGIVTHHLPLDAVNDVQIIENDQRIKILDSLVFSNKTTLNLKLKRFLTTGSASIGIGASPLLWNISLTPIIFNKAFQAIHSYQTNNTGNDLSNQLQWLTNDNLFEGTSKPNTPILSTDQLSPPPFDAQFWLNNNQHLFSTNFLQVLQKDLQFKFNASYLNDIRQQSGSSSTSYSIPGQIISLTEVKENNFNKNELKTTLVLEQNTKKIYVKENLSFEKEWDKTNAYLINGVRNIAEKLYGEPYALSNKLNIIKSIGKQLVSINSTLSLNTLSQALDVKPGQYDSLFNNNKPYDQVTQYLQLRNFQSGNYISMLKAKGRFTFSPKLGFDIIEQSLESSISTFTSSLKTELGTGFKNNLSLLKTTIYEDLGTQYRSTRLMTGFLLKISQQDYSLHDNRFQDHTTLNRVLYEPKFTLLLKLSSKYEVSGYSSLSNDFGEISQLYNAYILQSYRNLRRLNSTLPENRSFTNGINLNFKDPLSVFFYNVGYSISRVRKNLIFWNSINPDGSTTLETVLKDNSQQSQSLNGAISKYIKAIKTVIKLNGKWGVISSEQVINNSFNSINSNISGWGFTVSNTSFQQLNLTYDANFYFSSNKLNGTMISNVATHRHTATISFFPATNQMISFNTKYYYNTQAGSSNQAFINFLYRYTIAKKKIDLELACNNLLNADYFTNVFTDGFIVMTHQFKMRERQVLASVRFSF